MKRCENKFFFFFESFSELSNPSDELAQNVSKKYLSNELFLHFFFESSEPDRGFNYLDDSNSIFRAAGINSEIFFGRTVNVMKFDFSNESKWLVPVPCDDGKRHVHTCQDNTGF